jgi:hypothetical protein
MKLNEQRIREIVKEEIAKVLEAAAGTATPENICRDSAYKPDLENSIPEPKGVL